MKGRLVLGTVLVGLSLTLSASAEDTKSPTEPQTQKQDQAYSLGPLDVLIIRVHDVDDLDGPTVDPFRIDTTGDLVVPRIGRVHAAGLTLEQLELDLETRFRKYLKDPIVTVRVSEFHSKPVSVLGSVNTPGVKSL